MHKMIRILHVIGRMDRAGAETMVMNLYRVLDRTNFQFDFLYFTDDKCDFDEEIASLGGKIYHLPSYIYKNSITRMFGMKKLLKTNKYIQIIHCHTLFSNSFHLLAGKMAGVKVRIAHAHSTSDNNSNSAFGRAYQSISRFIIQKTATHFISCGEAAGIYLFPKIKHKMFLPNSVDTQKFASIARLNKEYLRKMLNLVVNTILIVQIGRFLEVKNHPFSIQLAANLKSRNVDFLMIFVGDGELKSEIKNLAHTMKVENQVAFLGLRSDIAEILAGSDLMILPSLYEGFPVVLVESQSAGVPALISDSISVEVDLGVGLIERLSLNNPLDNWVEKIEEILAKPKMEEKERLAILRDKGFDIHTSVKKLEKLYSGLN